jgi:thymidylate kinase
MATLRTLSELEQINKLVTAVFRAWQGAGIEFLVLRNYEELPHFTTNDIDVLVAPDRLRDAEKTLNAAALASGFRLHNRAEFATLALYFSSMDTTAQAHFDLFTALKWRSFDFLCCDDFLRSKVMRGLFAIPHPAHEAATNLLATMIYTGRVKEKYKPSIAAGFRAEAPTATDLLARTYDPAHAKFLVAAGAEGRWDEMEAATGALRQALILRQMTSRPLRTAASAIANAGRLTARMFRPPGLSVVLCGADGSGKSTAAAAIIGNLGGTFSPAKGRQFHWKLPVFSGRRIAERAPTQNPHGTAARNRFISLFYFGFHWLEFLLGSHLRMRPIAFRGGLVLIDRYYYDFFVDQRRYRLQVPQFLVQLGYVFLKKPDLVLLLDAPGEVLQSRKKEVPLAETERQRRAYRAVVEGFCNGRIINAAQSQEQVAADIRKVILDFMAKRAKTRGDLPSDAHPGRQ